MAAAPEPIRDPVRDLVRQLIHDDPALDLKAVSLAIGRNQAYMHQYLYSGVPHALGEADRHKLAAVLGVDETRLRPVAADASLNKSVTKVLQRFPLPTTGNKDLPVHGMAFTGKEGIFVLNRDTYEHLARPAQLMSVANGYAVYVPDERMEPACYTGDAAYVNPNRPLEVGRLVLVELNDHTAMIRLFLDRTSENLVLQQLKPAKRVEILLADVLHVHRIVLVGEP